MGTDHVFDLIDIDRWVLFKIDIQINVEMAWLVFFDHFVKIPTGRIRRFKNLVEEGRLSGYNVGAWYIESENTFWSIAFRVRFFQCRCYHHTMNLSEIHV